jgi:acyl-CoA thioesterase
LPHATKPYGQGKPELGNAVLSPANNPATIASMKANEVSMDAMKEFFKNDRYAAHTGVELRSIAPGHAIASLEIQPCHLNGLGGVQGGAIFTLADFAFAAAANSHNAIAVAINVNISYMKAITNGTLTAEAREISINPRLGTYTVNVTDDTGDLVAVFQGLAYRKKDQPVVAV